MFALHKEHLHMCVSVCIWSARWDWDRGIACGVAIRSPLCVPHANVLRVCKVGFGWTSHGVWPAGFGHRQGTFSSRGATRIGTPKHVEVLSSVSSCPVSSLHGCQPIELQQWLVAYLHLRLGIQSITVQLFQVSGLEFRPNIPKSGFLWGSNDEHVDLSFLAYQIFSYFLTNKCRSPFPCPTSRSHFFYRMDHKSIYSHISNIV